ncbi:MAG: DUF2264 domain-containing protein [Lachnospiraceae bacterium]|nr:DUF2264 domain-containing protein [Lachnospiraceae bacterium]
MKFQPTTLNFELSPYTGLTRESWIEAGKYLLQGIFENIIDFEDPVVMPRKETKITYPHSDAPEDIQEAERKAEKFEGLTRSFFIAAPLIHNEPELKICEYSMREYYKNQILRSCTKDDPIYVGTYEDLQEITGYADPYRAFQQTVETCALVICLWMCKEEIWDTYTKAEQDLIAGFLTSFAHANTVPQNWRLFNMLDMAFLHMTGYLVDHEIMMDHAQAILAYYAGDGWYRDGHSFDYYSCWAFNVYAPLWNLWYGYEKEPEVAKRFEEYSNKLMETYADFFDRDGFTNMWGRSNIYRNAATSAFDGNFFLENPTMDPGLARRVASGSLMQFLGREDFLYKGVPTLGFYGQFAPLVQGYSCAESPFWLGKAFLCLHLPADHPFWTAKENNGSWDTLGEKEVKVTTLNGPALCFSNHSANGETILRTGKVVKYPGDTHGMWNYSKLCFNTKYPWEAMPQPGAAVGCGANNALEEREKEQSLIGGGVIKPYGLVESQQYVLQDLTNGSVQKANVTFWHGEKAGVLYRRQFFDYKLECESHWIPAVDLADFVVPYGVVRVDKHRLFRRPVRFTLGAYGFPDNGTEIIRKECRKAKAIVLKGKDFTGQEKQLAMTIYDGWHSIDLLESQGTNPDSKKSVVIYATADFQKQYGSYEPYVMISQVITKESHDDFTEEELFPIEKVEYTDGMETGAYGPVTLHMKDGSCKVVDFTGIEACLLL